MTNSNDDVSARLATTGPAEEDPVSGAAEDQANFIRAVTIGLSELEAGREMSFDHPAIRLGLERGEVSSWAAIGGGCPVPLDHLSSTPLTRKVVHCYAILLIRKIRNPLTAPVENSTNPSYLSN